MAKKHFNAEQLIGNLRKAVVEISKRLTVAQVAKHPGNGNLNRIHFGAETSDEDFARPTENDRAVSCFNLMRRGTLLSQVTARLSGGRTVEPVRGSRKGLANLRV